MKIIILAGGAGTRLWPLSRTRFPKQFVKLKGMDKSILQMTISRCLRLAALQDIYIVTNGEYRFLIAGQMEEMGLEPMHDNILTEPLPKNTLPAIYNGVQHIGKDGDEIVAVFPSDHLINDEQAFCDTIRKGISLAQDYIVTFGIVATSPETGYGYIQPGESLGEGSRVRSFREKPQEELARQYVDDGYFWNAGMFMFRTDLFTEEVQRYSPEVFEAFRSASVEECFQKSPSISIDYGVMEHSQRVAVVPMRNDWSDLGSFAAVYDAYNGNRDQNGNVGDENSIIIDCHNSLIMGDNGDKPIAMIGLEDVVVIDNVDATLICKRDQSQRVKEVVSTLKQRKHKSIDAHNTDIRPWGSYTILEDRPGYKVKRITVLPGKTLSKQRHQHRNERWTVVQGEAIAILDNKELHMQAGDGLFIEAGHIHRLHNPGSQLLEIIEVMQGEYLGEDDIERIEDVYGRA